MTRATDSKTGYTNMIFQYIYRRNELRTRYHPWRTNEEYLRKVKPINQKIKNYRRAIGRIDKYNNQLHSINHTIREYYDLGMYKSVTNLHNLKIKASDKLFLVRKMFCKYTIEQGIPGSYVAKYVGWKDITQASRYRLEFTRAMQKDDILKQEWTKFKKFMDRVPLQKTG